MCAVFVFAAILLSIAPMHARTVLAALPPYTPGHSVETARSRQRIVHSAQHCIEPPLKSRRSLSGAVCPQARIFRLAAKAIASAPPVSLLAHSPNAP